MSTPVSADSSSPIPSRGWSVTLAGTGINLALGILYTWSVISKGVPAEWGWSQSDKAWPYAVACLVFSLIMVPAGRMQDKISPRFVATIGGVLVGLGMIVASRTTSAMGYILGFGVLAGAGIGFAYASATPPSIKWFPSAKTGLIAGIVVSGFGLASLYAAPLSEWLIDTRGLPQTVLILGVAFLVVVCGLAQFLVPPPAGYVPAGQPPKPTGVPGEAKRKEDYSPKEMLGTWQFWALWFMYACGAGAGLMIISVAKKIVAAEATESIAVAAVMGLAVGNGAGRVVAGTVSDKLGRKLTLFLFLVCQAVLLGLLTQAKGESPLASGAALILITALVGANYGSNLALFPSVTKDYFGLKNFGMNYGLVFTAWGVGGFVLAKIAGAVYDKTGSFNFAYILAAVLLVTAAIVTFAMKQPHQRETA